MSSDMTGSQQYIRLGQDRTYTGKYQQMFRTLPYKRNGLRTVQLRHLVKSTLSIWNIFLVSDLCICSPWVWSLWACCPRWPLEGWSPSHCISQVSWTRSRGSLWTGCEINLWQISINIDWQSVWSIESGGWMISHCITLGIYKYVKYH